MLQALDKIPALLKAVLLLVILTLGSFFLGRCTAPQSTQDKGGVSTRVETKVDTLYLPSLVVHDTVFTKPTLVTVYKNRPIPTVQPNGELTLQHRIYQDTTEVVKGLKVGYKAKVSGLLDTLELGIKDTRPTKIVEKTTTITNTLVKRPTGLYVGGFTNKELTNFGPSVDLVRPKFSLGVGYDLKQASPQFRVGINIFRDKK